MSFQTTLMDWQVGESNTEGVCLPFHSETAFPEHNFHGYKTFKHHQHYAVARCICGTTGWCIQKYLQGTKNYQEDFTEENKLFKGAAEMYFCSECPLEPG